MRLIILSFYLLISLVDCKKGHLPARSPLPAPKAPPPAPKTPPPSPSSPVGRSWILQTRLAHGIGNEFGSSISILHNKLLVGAENELVSGKRAGMAYVYHRIADNKWKLVQKCAPGRNTQNFGRSVSLQPFSFAVGAPGIKSESVWIYQYKNKTYTPQQVIYPPSSGTDFGSTVSLHENTLAVSSLNGVYLYGLSKPNKKSKLATRWTLQQIILQGKPVSSLSLQGSTLAVGRRVEGRVDIFTRVKDKKSRKIRWNMVQTIKPYNASGLDFFGESLSLNNGSLIVGAPLATINNQSYAGAAFLFRRNPQNMTFMWEQKISAGKFAAQNGNFGASVALQGRLAVVGQPGTPAVADAFMWNGTSWERSSNRLFVRENVSFRNSAVSVSNGTVVASGNAGEGGKSGVYVFVPQ